jgi:hypothetical protein
MVARLEAPHSLPDRLDYTGPFVPAAVREVRDDAVTFGDVIVGVAQASGHQPDEDFAFLRAVQVDVDDFPFSGLLCEQRGSDLHVSLRTRRTKSR